MPKLPPHYTLKTPSENGKPKNFARVFEDFGVVFVSHSGPQALAESCPWCGKGRFYVNMDKGLYDCKKCQTKGNLTTFLTWQHKQLLERATDDEYRQLKEKRGGIPLQTLKRHELAFDPARQRWLIPFKSRNGNVVNIQSYYPNKPAPNKFNLPELATSIYGLDRLSDDKTKILFLCEGPFDAIALDYHLGLKRAKYDILATPGPFQEKWAEHFKGRKVRALFDNDKGGGQHRGCVRKHLGESRVADELRVLKWPEGYRDGYDINNLVTEHPEISVVGFSLDNSVKVTAEPKLIVRHGRQNREPKPVDWVWPDHLRCGTYVSFSGQQGTFKSTIAQEIAARYSVGRPMPTSNAASMPPGKVLYLHAEDDDDAVRNGYERAGGDKGLLITIPAQTKDGDPLNMLEHLEEIKQVIQEHNIRLVFIDGQNSVVGSPRIDTDMLARSNVTNKLHQFAQHLDICLIGIRNEDKEGRAMGPQSMADIGRGVMRAIDEAPNHNPRFGKLIFHKVNDRARSTHPPIAFSVKDHGGSHREILWGVSFADALKAELRKKREAAKKHT